MKTSYELRVEKQLEPVRNPDSEYKAIERVPKVFQPLIVPKVLAESLPFKSKEKVKKSNKRNLEEAENEGIPKIFANHKDKEVAALIQRLNQIRNEKVVSA